MKRMASPSGAVQDLLGDAAFHEWSNAAMRWLQGLPAVRFWIDEDGSGWRAGTHLKIPSIFIIRNLLAGVAARTLFGANEIDLDSVESHDLARARELLLENGEAHSFMRGRTRAFRETPQVAFRLHYQQVCGMLRPHQDFLLNVAGDFASSGKQRLSARRISKILEEYGETPDGRVRVKPTSYSDFVIRNGYFRLRYLNPEPGASMRGGSAKK